MEDKPGPFKKSTNILTRFGTYAYYGPIMATPKPELATEQVAELEKNYYELIFAVGSKFSNETRHETALRYIRERELAASIPSSEKEQ